MKKIVNKAQNNLRMVINYCNLKSSKTPPPMNINFQYDGVKASNRLEIMAAQRISKMFDKFDFIVRADVFFKTENTSNPNTGMICNIRLSIPGPRLFAEASHNSFEASIAESSDELQRQLQKRKDKMKAHH